LGNGIARQQSEAQYRHCGPTDNLTLIHCILPNSLAQPSTYRVHEQTAQQESVG
jgi:hypothetical protein